MNKYIECLNAIRTIYDFMYGGQGTTCTMSFWSDQNGDGFGTDFGYFEDGLDGLADYCFKKLSDENFCLDTIRDWWKKYYKV